MLKASDKGENGKQLEKTVRYFANIACLLLFLLIFVQYAYADELKICFTGDLLLDRGVRERINKKGADFLFEGVSKLFSECDAVVVNLECPVTKQNTPINKKYIFRAEPQWLTALKKAGITHASLANNHTNDQGRGGIKDTVENLSADGIIAFGAGKNAVEAGTPAFIEKGKVKMALFNSVLVPLENWVYLKDEYGVCQNSVDELCEKIKKLKEKDKNCYAAVILHWGVEYAALPDIMQRRQARKLIDSGADVVIGHHPHVAQPAEVYKGKYIFYSLGNFIFDSKRAQANKGLLAVLTFTENGIEAKKYPYEIKQCVPFINKEIKK